MTHFIIGALFVGGLLLAMSDGDWFPVANFGGVALAGLAAAWCAVRGL